VFQLTAEVVVTTDELEKETATRLHDVVISNGGKC